MARLVLHSPDGQRVAELGPYNSLGRHPSNSLQLLDRIMSKEHCVIELRADGYWLRDLGSLNGTFINNERVLGERKLQHGDEIVMGGTHARFDDGRGLAPQYPPAPAMPAAMPRVPVGPAETQPNSPVPAVPSGVQQVCAVPSPVVPAPQPRPPAARPAVMGGARTMAIPAFAAEGQPLPPGRVDVMEQQRAIGTQIAATEGGFRPFDQVYGNPVQLRADYERLRLSYELSREIALERDTTKLLAKILQSLFKSVRADRGVIFLRDESGKLKPGASLRRDGSEAPIVVSSTILNHVERERAAVLSHDAAMDFAASKGKSMILNRITSAIVVPLLYNDESLGVMWLDSESLAQFQPRDLELVAGVAAQAALFIANNMLANKIEREIITRDRFSRLLSPNIAERVISGELEVKKGGELVNDCTVFNSDIRGFTRMSAASQPEIIVEMLNEYFELMVETLFKYEGTLDKFMGDGLMALWGAPIAHPDDPVRAVDCALEQMQVLGQFNRQRVERNLPPLGVGIGIHVGPLVAGYIGSSKALSYTVIGDTVNTSARLCGHAKTGEILVSESALARLGGRYQYQELPPATLKGKEQPLRVFNIQRKVTLP